MVIGLVIILILIGLIIGVFGIVLCSVYENMEDLYGQYLVTSDMVNRISVHMAAIEQNVAKLASEKEE